MVWMPDSERAAEIARAEGLPIGLHLNLIEPYKGDDVPRRARETQLRVTERFRLDGGRALLYEPRWRDDFERCIADQLSRFEHLYGASPTHVDGHRHSHLALNAVFARSLRPVRRLRRAFTFRRSERPAPKRLGRALLSAAVRTRFDTTRYLFSIRTLHPALGGTEFEAKLELTRGAAVEVMVHPEEADELRVLRSGEWSRALAPHPLGSFADL
jgi:predicted glycoside hydrolase/deacetylase ChbG (UPF0249 family)